MRTRKETLGHCGHEMGRWLNWIASNFEEISRMAIKLDGVDFGEDLADGYETWKTLIERKGSLWTCSIV